MRGKKKSKKIKEEKKLFYFCCRFISKGAQEKEKPEKTDRDLPHSVEETACMIPNSDLNSFDFMQFARQNKFVFFICLFHKFKKK